MENAADALKIVLAVFIFSIGLVLLFNMASQAKETARILIAESDPTKYYEYYKDATDEEVDENGNRIVKLKDIIPTLYRYSQENYGVTIVDKEGNIVGRFDLDTEQACNDWIEAELEKKKRFIIETRSIYMKANKLAKQVNGKEINFYNKGNNDIKKIYRKSDGTIDYGNPNYANINTEEMEEIFIKLYSQKTNANIKRPYYCFWIGSMGWTSQRIDSDLSGIDAYFSSNKVGSQAEDEVSQPGNHICCIKEPPKTGLVEKFKDSTFTEYLINVDRNSYITEDDESLFSFGEIMEPIKRELIYIEN